MAAIYRDRISALIAGLSSSTEMAAAKEALRALADRIVLTPDAAGGELVIDVEGALAGLLQQPPVSLCIRS